MLYNLFLYISSYSIRVGSKTKESNLFRFIQLVKCLLSVSSADFHTMKICREEKPRGKRPTLNGLRCGGLPFSMP